MPTTPVPVFATASMSTVGYSVDDVLELARHAIHLLETAGPAAISLAKNVLKAVGYFAGRDMLGVWAAVNAAVVDAQAVIAAIRAEFADFSL